MKEPVIKKTPTEMFGVPYMGHDARLKQAMRQQYCTIVQGPCSKPRKSESEKKVGICSVGYRGQYDKLYTPVIICPRRFRDNVLFDTIRDLYLSDWDNIQWITEVNMGVGGFVDYVAITTEASGKIKDFLCVEIQAAGTTGTPYDGVLDFQKHGCFKSDNYDYGINWANEFLKTMMQQAYKKGKIVNHWKRKIVFVLQDVAMQYIEKASNVSRLRPFDKKLSVDFCTFALQWNEHTDTWDLHHHDVRSTDIKGIELMLGGADVDLYPTEDDFIRNIVSKGIADEKLDKQLYKELYL